MGIVCRPRKYQGQEEEAIGRTQTQMGRRTRQSLQLTAEYGEGPKEGNWARWELNSNWR
jgi:hypothetical protein